MKDTGGNANCVCGKGETQWHVMSACKHNGNPTVRKRLDKTKESDEVTNWDLCYPDWSRTSAGRHVYKFKHQNEKGGEAHEEAPEVLPSLVSKRTPNEDSQTQHETMLVSELTRWAFSKKWYWQRGRRLLTNDCARLSRI